MSDLKPEYGDLTAEAWGELRAKARELHAAVGTNRRWQYIAIEAFPELLEDNRIRLERSEVIERLTDELVVTRRLLAEARGIVQCAAKLAACNHPDDQIQRLRTADNRDIRRCLGCGAVYDRDTFCGWRASALAASVCHAVRSAAT